MSNAALVLCSKNWKNIHSEQHRAAIRVAGAVACVQEGGDTPIGAQHRPHGYDWEVLKGVGVDGGGGNLPFFFAFWRESPLQR